MAYNEIFSKRGIPFIRYCGKSYNVDKYDKPNEYGSDEEAIEHYDKVIKNDPDNTGAWHIKGMLLIKLGKYNKAVDLADMVIDRDPVDAMAWLIKGIALYELEDYDEARDCLNEALRINPSLVNILDDMAIDCYD